MCPRMGNFMNVGSDKCLSRFSEILNSVMEKIHSAKVERVRLLLFRDSWYLGSFFSFLSREQLCVSAW